MENEEVDSVIMALVWNKIDVVVIVLCKKRQKGCNSNGTYWLLSGCGVEGVVECKRQKS